MQAIQTKYFGPTNSRGARIKATCDAASITAPYNHALDLPGNHRTVALTLMTRLGWGSECVSGCLPDGSYAHVQAATDPHDFLRAAEEVLACRADGTFGADGEQGFALLVAALRKARGES